MDGSRNPAIDYQAAADACLVALSSIAVKLVLPPSGGGPSGAGALTGRTVHEPGTNNQEPVSPRPVSAVRLCKVIFPWEIRKLWTHETQRRRVREAVVVARALIPWRASPCGFTQIVELRRVKVRICYRCQNGRPRFALVPASKVCLQQRLFQMQNPFNRGEILRTKTFKLTTSSDR